MGVNSELWDSVCKTDTEFTKKVNQRGGYTSICPQYQLREATRQFGPYGKGFGLSETSFDMSLFDALGVVIHKAVFFYLDSGERSEFPISNAIQATTGSGDKKRLDVDFAKKVETNTVSKALSKLGFNADVYMGMFEDYNYLTDLNNELAIQKADDKNAEKVRVAEEYDGWKSKQKEVYKHLNTESALKATFAGHWKKCERNNDESGCKEFKELYDNRMNEIKANG